MQRTEKWASGRMLVLAALLAVAIGTAAQASIISINIQKSSGEDAVDGPTGVVLADNWNNLGANNNPFPGGLVDANGDPVAGVDVDLGGTNGKRNEQPSGTELNDLLDGGTNGQTPIIITGLGAAMPAGYDLYVYGWNSRVGSDTEGIAYTVDGVTQWVRGPQPSNIAVTAFVEGGGPDLTDAAVGSNYVKFSGLSGDLSLAVSNTGGENTVSGLQIVEIPEPASMALLAIGCLTIARRRR